MTLTGMGITVPDDPDPGGEFVRGTNMYDQIKMGK